MHRDYRIYLKDILSSISKIDEYVGELSFQDLVKDGMRVDAVVRNLEIIGEAAKHVPEDIRNKYPFVDWRKISAFRDILIQEYFGVDFDILWDIVKNKIPILKNDVKKILEPEKS